MRVRWTNGRKDGEGPTAGAVTGVGREERTREYLGGTSGETGERSPLTALNKYGKDPPGKD